MDLKLKIELVPSSSWYSNVRSNVSKSEWELIKKDTFKKAGNVCEICLGKGHKWPVECHEIWIYDDINKIQKLERTIALCPSCHQVKHIGLAKIKGNFDSALNHFKKVNCIDHSTAIKEVDLAFKVFNLRSKYKWILDIDWLTHNYNLKGLK